jgi:biopolymer transport protein ExbD
MRRRRKHNSQEDVELNLAAMLDMAFQLLTFFILTFKPAPVEGQVNLRLPPPMGITAKADAPKPGETQKPDETPQGLTTLTISVFSNKAGMIGSLAVGETAVGSVTGLDGKLQAVFAEKDSPFDQVIIQVGPELRYDELMKVIEVCTHQTIAGNRKLSKLSFVEAAPSG